MNWYKRAQESQADPGFGQGEEEGDLLEEVLNEMEEQKKAERERRSRLRQKGYVADAQATVRDVCKKITGGQTAAMSNLIANQINEHVALIFKMFGEQQAKKQLINNLSLLENYPETYLSEAGVLGTITSWCVLAEWSHRSARWIKDEWSDDKRRIVMDLIENGTIRGPNHCQQAASVAHALLEKGYEISPIKQQIIEEISRMPSGTE